MMKKTKMRKTTMKYKKIKPYKSAETFKSAVKRAIKKPLEEAEKKYNDFHYEPVPGKKKRAFNLQRYLDNNDKKIKALAKKKLKPVNEGEEKEPVKDNKYYEDLMKKHFDKMKKRTQHIQKMSVRRTDRTGNVNEDTGDLSKKVHRGIGSS